MKKEDEEIFNFDEFKLDKKESILEKKYKKIISLKINNQDIREKTNQEKIILLSFGFFLGSFYGVSLGLALSLYFSLKFKLLFKRQFYMKCGSYSGFIFGMTLGFYSYLFFDPNVIKEKILLRNFF